MMQKISLTRGLVATVDDEDFESLSQHLWFANGCPGRYYAMRRIGDKKITMHRVIMQASAREQVDHINGDSLDNRRCNLRICTSALNLANQARRAGSSRYRGVRRIAQGWRADICIRGQRRFLGNFATEELAAIAWNKAAAEGWGSFARLNVIGTAPAVSP